jgi:hypothetical protein
MPWVYSTATNDTIFTEYSEAVDGMLPVAKRWVTVKGGANLPERRTLITPYGIGTEISKSDAEFLSNDNLFNTMVKNGFMKLMVLKYDAEKVAADMKSRDGSSPLVPQDYTQSKAPTVNGEAKSDPKATAPKPVPSFVKQAGKASNT